MATDKEEWYYDPRRLADLIEPMVAAEMSPPLVGSRDFTLVLSFALAFLPKETVEKVLKGCCFVEISSTQPSRHVSAQTAARRYVIIILTDEMLQKPETCVSSILCETAHYLSGHQEPEPSLARKEAARSMVINWLLEYSKYFPSEQAALGEIFDALRQM